MDRSTSHLLFIRRPDLISGALLLVRWFFRSIFQILLGFLV
uniref:Uncharacterized protein n=1 Tax=Rhizophora mucronata TaxID=61149 RepID=A0A2P2R1T4_RHIMU